MNVTSDAVWWGDFELEPRQCGRWRIGPSCIWIQRLDGEWRIATGRADDGDETIVDIEVPSDDIDLMKLDTVARFGVSGTEQTLSVQPRLADRPVVTRPERPFYIAPHETVRVFVSTPLWLAISPGNAEHALEEIPIARPSDTWFGTSTRSGELCYASRTACRLRLDDLPIRPHRASSEVRVRNEDDHELLLERMQLPVEHLALYQAEDGSLWTQDVELERGKNDEPSPLRIQSGPPRVATDGPCVAPARREVEENTLIRAFGALFR